MRKDIREEEKRQAKNKAKSGKSLCLLSKILGIVYLVALAVFEYLIISSGVIPTKFIILQAVVLLLISILILPMLLINRARKKNKIVATVISVILLAVYGVGIVYLGSTMGFLNGIIASSQTVTYDVVVGNDNRITEEDTSGLQGAKVLMPNSSDDDYIDAAQVLQEDFEVTFEQSSKDNKSLLESLVGNAQDIVFIRDGYYQQVCDNSDDVSKGTRIVYTVKISKAALAAKSTDVTSQTFNVLLTGNDTKGELQEGLRSDVNMIMTVNPKTKKIHLTSIPRDYYIALPQNGEMDKLTHTGIYGVDCTSATLENLFGIEINYYVRVNFTAVEKLVDAIGGLTIKSDYAFTTSGRFNNGFEFVVGENQVDGKKALAFCRERHAFADGDNQRVKDQQIVIQAIVDKLTTSTVLLTDYTDVLGAIEKYMETNMSADEIKSLVKMQLDDMSKWKFSKYAVVGGEGSHTNMCYSLGCNAWVMPQSEKSIAKAVKEMNEIRNNPNK
ncbi:MAG: LCP family protein [Clostridia bacterium]|nr:LCP family protein [Clostridia bacterium]